MSFHKQLFFQTAKVGIILCIGGMLCGFFLRLVLDFWKMIIFAVGNLYK